MGMPTAISPRSPRSVCVKWKDGVTTRHKDEEAARTAILQVLVDHGIVPESAWIEWGGYVASLVEFEWMTKLSPKPGRPRSCEGTVCIRWPDRTIQRYTSLWDAACGVMELVSQFRVVPESAWLEPHGIGGIEPLEFHWDLELSLCEIDRELVESAQAAGQ